MAKENDLFLNQLENLDFNAFDFSKVGLDASNTSLESKDVYKNLDYVKNHPVLQTNGSFDEAKFNNIYDNLVLVTYNQMANNEVGDLIGKNASFYRNNIYAPESQKRRGYDTTITKVANPLRTSTGFNSSVDAITESPFSIREIAQTQKVWDNKTKSWQESPNDASMFKNFGQTLVLAQWDEDGTHNDPITGELVSHKKGDKKLNDYGTYYYETLNGRSVYGRDVLSKWDTLTVDGSKLNKFDPFDSDDKESNIFGSINKSAIKIVPALFKKVSPWYIGLRVAINTADLFAALGNMVTDGAFNGVEGYIKSLGYSTSDYGQERPWALENIINMSADVFTQLAEQRWIFKYPTSSFKGGYGITLEGREKLFAEELNKISKKTHEEISELLKSGKYIDKARIQGELPLLNQLYADSQVAKYTNNYQEIGRILSMSYMTGITVKDSYAEAKAEGASDLEAALLTLGYAAGEYALINSDLGRWILPELRAESNRWKQIVKTLEKNGLKEADNIRTQDKGKIVDWAKRVLHVGKGKALSDYDLTKKQDVIKLTGKAMIANALGEGVEETSEELLYDISKTLANFAYNTFGSDTKLTTFDNLFNRYGLSFVGGVIGGGLGQVSSEYRQAASLKNMSEEQAFKELVQVVKEGKSEEFLKVIDKSTWASTKLSNIPADLKYDVYGNPISKEGELFLPADENNKSQDQTIKDIIHQYVSWIDDMLNVEGAHISNNSLIGQIQTIDDPLKEFRAATLFYSTFARGYISDYKKAVDNLAKAKDTLVGLDKKLADTKDSEKKQLVESDNYKNERKIAEEEINNCRKILEEFKDGTKINELTKRVLFETSVPIVESFKHSKLNLTSFLENIYRKPIDKLSPTELEQGTQEFQTLYEQDGEQQLESLYQLFSSINQKASTSIKNFAEKYFSENSFIGNFRDFVFKETIATQKEDDESNIIRHFASRYNSQIIDSNLLQLLKSFENIGILSISYNEIKENLQDENKSDEDKSNYILKVILDSFNNDINNGKQLLSDIENSQYITAVIKNDLNNTFDKILGNLIIEDPETGDYVYYGGTKGEEIIKYIRELKNTLDNTKYSPISEFLDNFSVAAKNKKDRISISQLIDNLDDQFTKAGNQNTLSELSYNSEDTEEQIENALYIIELAKASIQAARTDDAKYGDIFGYNVVVNSIDKSDLAEIDSNIADTILQELEEVYSRLTYYNLLININSNNKLKTFDRSYTKGYTLIFDKILKRFNLPDYPPGNQEAAEELRRTLNNTDNFKLLRNLQLNLTESKNNWNIPIEKQKDLQEEIKLLFDSLHTFFNKNESMLNNIEELSKFLDPNITNIHQLDTELLNINSNDISDSSFIWILASLSAMNPSKFMSLYQSTIKQDGLIPVIGQELGVMIAYSAILNNKVFNNFVNAYNLALNKFAETNDIRGQGEFLGVDSDVSIDFTNTVLIEGIAGAGKSLGATLTLIKLIKANPHTKHLLDNVWVVHTTEDKAKNLSEKLGISNIKTFSHTSLMKHISGTNSITGRSWNEIINPDGSIDINQNDLEYEEGKPLRYNFPLNSTDKPSLIIIDEISHMSVPSLLLVDKLANESGCTNLTLGDFHQSGIQHKIENPTIRNIDGTIKALNGTFKGILHNTNFIHAPKLGESLRTNNKFKDYNNNLFLVHRDEFINTDNPSKIAFKYSELQSGELYGDKLFNIFDEYDSVDNLQEKLDLFETQVRTLLNKTIQLGSNAKLGYIYDISKVTETNSLNISKAIHQIMQKLAAEDIYKNRISFNEGSSAQGDENPYYIINFGESIPSSITSDGKMNPDRIQYINDLYTGITRAQEGSIIINYNGVRTLLQSSILDNSSRLSPIKKEVKDNFIAKKQKIYEEVYGNPNPDDLPLQSGQVDNDGISNDNLPYPIGTIVTDGTNEYKIIKFDGKVTLQNINNPTEFKNISLEELKSYNLVGQETSIETPEQEISKLNSNLDLNILINNDDENDLQVLHHSFNADEIGLNPDGTFGKWNDVRLDNIIGLAKIIRGNDGKLLYESPLNNNRRAVLIDTLRKIRYIARTADSEQNLLDRIYNVIHKIDPTFSTDGISARFFYKVSQREEILKEKVYKDTFIKGKYLKPESEKVKRFVDDTERFQKSNDATISLMLIDRNGNEIFETSVLTDTNPLTLAQSRGFEEINKWINNYRNNNPRSNFITILNKLEQELTLGSLKGVKNSNKLLRQIYMFKATHDLPLGGQIQFLKNSKGDWLVLGRDWINTGITFDNEQSETIVNLDEFVEYTGETISLNTLKNSGIFVTSENAYIAPNDIVINQGIRTITVKAGHPFIIITDNIEEFSNGVFDGILWNEFLNGNKNFSIIYVEPESKSFYDYLVHLNSVYDKNSEILNTSLSGYTTSLRILEQLFSTKEGTEFIIKRLDELFKSTINSNELSKEIQNLVNRFSNIKNTKSGIESELIVELNLFVDSNELSNTFKTLCSFKEGKTKYINIFEKLVRILSLGQMNNALELYIKSPLRDDQNIKDIENLIQEKFKHGFFTRITYSHADGAKIGEENNTVIQADLPIEKIKVRGTINTSSLITKGQESDAYEKQKEIARTTAQRSPSGHDSTTDSRNYETNKLMSVIDKQIDTIEEFQKKNNVILSYQLKNKLNNKIGIEEQLKLIDYRIIGNKYVSEIEISTAFNTKYGGQDITNYNISVDDNFNITFSPKESKVDTKKINFKQVISYLENTVNDEWLNTFYETLSTNSKEFIDAIKNLSDGNQNQLIDIVNNAVKQNFGGTLSQEIKIFKEECKDLSSLIDSMINYIEKENNSCYE